MNENNLIAKWIRILMYVAVASLVNSVLNVLPFVSAAVTNWIGRGAVVVALVCMFKLAPVNPRYQKAGIFRAVMLGCTLLTALLALPASILSIVAVYQEYNAHSELTAQKDSKLSHQWHSLFYWSMVSGLLIGFATMVGVVIAALVGMDAAKITNIIVVLLSLPQIVIDGVYLLYLKKMLGCFREEA